MKFLEDWKDTQEQHKKSKGRSPFCNFNAGDVEKGVETFNKNTTLNTSDASISENVSLKEYSNQLDEYSISDDLKLILQADKEGSERLWFSY